MEFGEVWWGGEMMTMMMITTGNEGRRNGTYGNMSMIMKETDDGIRKGLLWAFLFWLCLEGNVLYMPLVVYPSSLPPTVFHSPSGPSILFNQPREIVEILRITSTSQLVTQIISVDIAENVVKWEFCLY